MAILKYIKQNTVKQYPVEFQCDVCKSVFKLKDKHDIINHSNIEQQMAVVKYMTPAGYDFRQEEIHCCSTKCLIEVLTDKKIDISGARITLPMDGLYTKYHEDI